MNTVTIDRLQFALVASAAPDRANTLLARLRDVLAVQVPQAMAQRMPDAAMDTDNQGYLFVEQLAFDCPLNAAWSDDRLADALATTLATALAASETRPAGNIAFRERAEYLAAFLIALAEGSAWRQWCFDEFIGLQLLPTSGALRTVLIAEGNDGRAALARLTDQAIHRVLLCLTGADAARLLAHWLAHLLAAQPGNIASLPPATLLQLLDTPLAAALADGPQRRLAWLVALGRIVPAYANPGTLDTLAWLDTLCHAGRAGKLHAALEIDMPPSSVLAACCHVVGLDGALLAAWSDPDCTELLARLRALAPPGRTGAASSAPERAYCPHGGAWLLLVQLVRLGWWTRWHARLQAADPGNADGLAARLVLAVLARALGGQAYAAIEADGTLRRALGVADDPQAGTWTQGRQQRLANTLALPAPPTPDGAGIILGSGRRRRLAQLDAARGTVVALRPFSHQPVPDGADAAVAAARAWWQACDPLRNNQAPLERALHLNALNLLREFAARLPGCSESGPGHLRSQCLHLGAGVATGAGHVTAHLGRAPLDVLLMLAGLKRSSVTLPDGRMLALQPDSAP